MKTNQIINIFMPRGYVAAAAFALFVNCLSSATAFAHTNAPECNAECRQEIAQAVAATEPYHFLSAASADGFIETEECAAAPGLGGMGIHYLNVARASDLTVKAGEPELLLYEPTRFGKRRLVGVEYFVPVISNGAPWFDAKNPPPVIDNAAPKLFGKTFDGPMPGHEPGMPWHYDLHVWIWKYNPSGLFAPFNPLVRCSE